MTDVLIVGGGVVGMGLGMILANDGHTVTMLERDAAPPPSGPDEAWERLGSQGGHAVPAVPPLPGAPPPDPRSGAARGRGGDRADGGLRLNPMQGIPDAIGGGFREGDERFELLSGRRAVVERAVASVAEEARASSLRRGVAVAGLLQGPDAIDGIPHVTGVRTADGEEVRADLVIDCSGRRSALPTWLEALGARPPAEEVEDSGFIYLARHFRSRDGQMPFALGPLLQSYGSISVLTLPADNATWSVTLVARSGDRALLGLKDVARWESVVRSLPTVAHWIDGDPIEDRIITMAKIEDRHRDLRPDGVPVATGVLAVADAWACTNPSVGRGASIGMLHAQTLRDTLRDTGPDRPGELSEAFAVATADIVEPWFQRTLAFDRHRLAEMAAEAEGVPYEPDDPAYEMTGALAEASSRDPDVLRGFLDIVGALELPGNVMARPGMFEKVIEYGRRLAYTGADRTGQGRARRPGDWLSDFERRRRRHARGERRGRNRVRGDGRGTPVDPPARLSRFGEVVAPPDRSAGGRRLQGHRPRHARLRRLGQAGRGGRLQHPLSRGRRGAVLDQVGVGGRTWSGTTGAPRWPGRWPRWRPIGSIISSRLSVGHPLELPGRRVRTA